jgi:hypothetical protein
MRCLTFVVLLVALGACPPTSRERDRGDSPKCQVGCPCGRTCIDCDKTCTITNELPRCEKGCPCGRACIDCSKRCTK